MDNIVLPPARCPTDDASTTRGDVVAMFPSFPRLQKRDPACNLHHYYILDLQPPLVGGWSVIREWGRLGHPDQMKVVLCDTREEAALVSASAQNCTKSKDADMPERICWMTGRSIGQYGRQGIAYANRSRGGGCP